MFKISRSLFFVICFVATLSFLLTGCSKNPASTTPIINSTNVSAISSATNQSTAAVPAGSTVTSLASDKTTTATTNPPKVLTAEEIATNSIVATGKMNSLKFNMDFSMSFTLLMEDVPVTMTMQQTATSSVNIPDMKMGMIMDMVMEIPNQGTQNMAAEIYLTDGWMYMKANVPGVGDQWTKMKLTEELWAMQSKLSNMTDFLMSPVGLELSGSEKINGIECYVLNVVPDIASLTSWMEGQMQSGQTGIDLSGFDMSKILDNFTVKEWIAKDSYLVIKQQIGIKLDMASLDTGNSTSVDQMKMDMSATITYYDYGKPVTIELPPEALNATETVLPQ